MESAQHIKSRLASVKNIGQITKAMEVVSATKMRKAQSVALSSRGFSYSALAALADLLRFAPSSILEASPLAIPREVNNTLIIVVASDRGLAGSFNSQVGRALDDFFVREKTGADVSAYRAMVVGKKITPYVLRKKIPVEDVFTGFGDHATPEEVSSLSAKVIEGYLAGKWDRVVVISTHFKTTLSQHTVTREVLPFNLLQVRETVREIVPDHGRFSGLRNKLLGDEKVGLTDYIFEPSPEIVLSKLLPHLLRMELYHLILEANASEHSARMVAMKNASENSKELTEDLTLSFNKVRQAGITKEMIEIVSAQTAIT